MNPVSYNQSAALTNWDEDAACEATTTMWLTFAKELNSTAAELLANSESYEDAVSAAKFALLADACYWQATGIVATAELPMLLGMSGESAGHRGGNQ